jgi:hypothetical protein
VERDFAGDGDAGLIRAQIVIAVAKTERGGEREELAARMRVEEALCLGVVGNSFAEIKLCCSAGQAGPPGERGRDKPGKRSLFQPGSPHFRLRSSSW